MSLPPSYVTCSIAEYMESAVTFLRDHKWVYDHANTELLYRGVLTKDVPLSWVESLRHLNCQNLNEIPFGYYDESWPESLKDFVCKCEQLKPRYSVVTYENDDANGIPISKQLLRGLSLKKQHEVKRLSLFVHEHCKRHNITTIIDVGAGLGYLSYLLHENYGYRILAIESETVRFNSAIKRQQKYFKHSVKYIHYVQHHVGENSAMKINQFLCDWQQTKEFKENTCLIGLHACADLTVTALNIFKQLPFLKLSVIMPCCYHKMQMDLHKMNSVKVTSNENKFERFFNFPLSNDLKKIDEKLKGYEFMRRPFLRLACQSSASVWREMTELEHRQHSISSMRRNVLELFARQENYTLVRLKRKCMNRFTSSNCDLETYLKQLQQGYYLVNDPEGRDCTLYCDCTTTCVCTANCERTRKMNRTPADNDDEFKPLSKATGDCDQIITIHNRSADNRQTDVEETPANSSCLLAIDAKRMTEPNCSISITKNSRQIEKNFNRQSSDEYSKQMSNETESAKIKEQRLTFADPEIKEKITALWMENEKHCRTIEILTCLQNCVQGICENIILLDRVAFLQQSGVWCRVEKVTHDHISPRCYALVALKNS